jgi:LCP family protein required for cell wall assembly
VRQTDADPTDDEHARRRSTARFATPLGAAPMTEPATQEPVEPVKPVEPVEPVEPSGPEGAAAGAEGVTHGFSWVLLWTVLGSLVPGLGLVAAGRRKSGVAVLTALAVVAAGTVIWVLRGDVLRRGLSFAVDPHRLLVLAVAVIAAGVLWALLILLSHDQLRREAVLGRSQKISGWVLAVVLVVGAAAPTYVVAHDSLVQRDLIDTVFNNTADVDVDADDAKPDAVAPDPWAGTRRINVLLIGSDAGADRTGIRPDTLIVASIQPSSGNTVLFSLPRNLEHVPFKKNSIGARAWPDGYYCADDSCLMNAVWTWAEGGTGYAKFRNPGLQATEDAVTGVTGLEIDTYVMLNLKGFQDFVDAIGGLTLDVHERLPIGGDSEHPWQTIGYIEPGLNQKMNGYHALWFARSRWSTSDYDRMRRQRCVIGAIAEQASPVTVARHFPSIARALKNNMSTGIPRSDLQAWVTLATRIQGAQTTSLPFTDDVVASRINPDYDLIHQQVAQAIHKSEQEAASSRTSAGPTPGVSAGPTPGATPTKAKAKAKVDKKKTQDADPSTAQDVSQVC